MKRDTMTFLELVREVRIGELLKSSGDERYEASGVCLKDGYLHVIFDDNPHLLRLRADWHNAEEAACPTGFEGNGSGL